MGRHWAIPASVRGELPSEASDWDTQRVLDHLYEKKLIYIPRDGAGQPKYKQYVGNGVPYQDIWAYHPYTQGCLHGTEEGIDEDVKWLEHDKERLGYPTQKPIGLLERIIVSSCPPGGNILDPFCGCGTTIAAAQHLNRQWTGIDITHLAITLIKHRLKSTFGSEVTFKVIGEPVDSAGAHALAQQDPYQFQWWALGLVGARPTEQKKGADQGIDGRLYFHDEAGEKTKQIVFSVKAGKMKAECVRDLRGVVEREQAQIGALISLEEPTKPMRTEAARAGFYESPFDNKRYPRLQLLTVKELLDGKTIAYPPTRANVTFKKAPPAKREGPLQEALPLAADPETFYEP